MPLVSAALIFNCTRAPRICRELSFTPSFSWMAAKGTYTLNRFSGFGAPLLPHHPSMDAEIKERGLDLLPPVCNVLDPTQGRGDWYTSLDYSPDAMAARR